MSKDKNKDNNIVKNKKAFFEYEILETFEAGLELKGSEVKAIRMGRVNLKDSFVRIIKKEAWLLGVHISHLNTAHQYYKPDEKRARKLLLHRKQIDKLFGKVSADGMTIICTNLHYSSKNIIKASIALAKGKSLRDKRETIKKREADREARSAMKNY